MDRDLGVVSASLGQLAVHYGLLSPAEHSSLVEALRLGAQNGEPDSCARRLIRRGIAQRAVSHLLSLGADLGAVLCDACGEAVPQGELVRRQAYACPRCANLMFGFRAFATEPRLPGEDSEETESLPYVPKLRESSETDRYDMVLPLPDEPALAPGAGREAFAETLREQEQAEPDMNQTLGFPQVFALPAGESSLSDNDATMILEAMLESPRPAAPEPEDDLRNAQTVMASPAELGIQPAAPEPEDDPRNAQTVMASAAELGVGPRSAPEEETLIASAEDLGLKALVPRSEAERPRLVERTSKLRVEPALGLEDEPALWPWLLALGLLCLATAIALGFLLATSS